jgi:hypothetical protein
LKSILKAKHCYHQGTLKDTKVVIKGKKKDDNLQNTTRKTKDCATPTPLNYGDKLGCSEMVSSSCSSSATSRVTLVTNPVNKTLRQKRNNFPIVNIPYICSNIPTAPAYDVYISQVIDIPELVVSIMICDTDIP